MDTISIDPTTAEALKYIFSYVVLIVAIIATVVMHISDNKKDKDEK